MRGREKPSDAAARVDEVVARLQEAITTGQLSAGERLAEERLALSFGVSRGPLREAIRTLEGRRLIERTPFSGVRVIELSIADLEQLLFTREVLEGLAARQAGEHMGLAEVRRLRASLYESEVRIANEGVGAVFRDGTQDNDFHLQIATASGNRWLVNFLCGDLYALIRVYRFRSANLGSRFGEATAEHHAIVDAIERREPDEAETLMRAHVARARVNLMAKLAVATNPS